MGFYRLVSVIFPSSFLFQLRILSYPKKQLGSHLSPKLKQLFNALLQEIYGQTVT